jgi:hypothetical protein
MIFDEKFFSLPRQNDEDRLRNFLGGVGVASASQRGGINEVHMTLHERGEGGLGIFPRKFSEQLVVIQFGHSPSNVRQTGKGTENYWEKCGTPIS